MHDDLNRICSASEKSAPTARPDIVQKERGDESDSSSALSSPSGAELISRGDSSFIPIYAIRMRENPADLENRSVSLAIPLTYGTVSIGDISINVLDSGYILQYVCKRFP